MTNTLKAGQRVMLDVCQNDPDATAVFTVVEPRGDRTLVRLVCDLPIPPTFVYLTADLVPVDADGYDEESSFWIEQRG